jgi:hypothetical protein
MGHFHFEERKNVEALLTLLIDRPSGSIVAWN